MYAYAYILHAYVQRIIIVALNLLWNEFYYIIRKIQSKFVNLFNRIFEL